jgi:hypothetical protein
VTSGPGGQQLGAGRRGAAWHVALTGGPGSTVPLGSVLNRFKLNQKYSKRFKRIQNSPNFD